MLQHARQVLPASAKAADDDVALVPMDLRAMVVICSDCCSQSLATSFITIQLLYWIRKGVASIDSTMAARMGFISAGRIRPALLRERQQHKAELARLRQEQPGAQRHPGGGPMQRASTRKCPPP